MRLSIDGNKVLTETAYVAAAVDRSGWLVKVKLVNPPRFSGDDGKPGPIIGDGTLIVGVYEKRQVADAVAKNIFCHDDCWGRVTAITRQELERKAGAR